MAVTSAAVNFSGSLFAVISWKTSSAKDRTARSGKKRTITQQGVPRVIRTKAMCIDTPMRMKTLVVGAAGGGNACTQRREGRGCRGGDTETLNHSQLKTALFVEHAAVHA
jgi:hypothetical protein